MTLDQIIAGRIAEPPQRSPIAASAGRVERQRNDRLYRPRTGSALETSETGLMYYLGPTLRLQGALGGRY